MMASAAGASRNSLRMHGARAAVGNVVTARAAAAAGPAAASQAVPSSPSSVFAARAEGAGAVAGTGSAPLGAGGASAGPNSDTRRALMELIERFSTSAFHIEYRVFFSSHVVHGLVSMERIGASGSAMEDFAKYYTAEHGLEPTDRVPTDVYKLPMDQENAHLARLGPDAVTVTRDNLNEFLGRRQAFYALKDFFAREIDEEAAGIAASSMNDAAEAHRRPSAGSGSGSGFGSDSGSGSSSTSTPPTLKASPGSVDGSAKIGGNTTGCAGDSAVSDASSPVATHSDRVGGAERVLRRHIPLLLPGLSGAALHGIIHLGYGIEHMHDDGGNLLAEGLAYAAFAYVGMGPIPVSSTLFAGLSPPVNAVVGSRTNAIAVPDPPALLLGSTLESAGVSSAEGIFSRPAFLPPLKAVVAALDTVREDKEGALAAATAHSSDTRYRHIPFHTVGENGFQIVMASLGDHGQDALLRLLANCCWPLLGTVEDNSPAFTAESVGRFAFDAALHAYVYAEKRNDFFLLHAVTACWAFRRALDYLPSSAARRDALLLYLQTMLAAYRVQGAPVVDPSVTLPEPPSWERLTAVAVANATKIDEHAIKLTHMARDRAFESDRNETLDLLCRTASAHSLSSVLPELAPSSSSHDHRDD